MYAAVDQKFHQLSAEIREDYNRLGTIPYAKLLWNGSSGNGYIMAIFVQSPKWRHRSLTCEGRGSGCARSLTKIGRESELGVRKTKTMVSTTDEPWTTTPTPHPIKIKKCSVVNENRCGESENDSSDVQRQRGWAGPSNRY